MPKPKAAGGVLPLVERPCHRVRQIEWGLTSAGLLATCYLEDAAPLTLLFPGRIAVKFVRAVYAKLRQQAQDAATPRD